MPARIYLSFQGAKITRTIPPDILVTDSPMTQVLPEGCSQSITYIGPDAVSKVLLPEDMSAQVREAAASVGMVEV